MWSWSSNSVKTHHPRYPNVNLNSISLYKGVFMEPLGDKFLCPIASLGWHLSVEYNGLVHILNNTYLQHQTWLHDYDGHAGMRQQSLKEKILTFSFERNLNIYSSTEHSDLLIIDLIGDWFQSVYLAFCLLHFTFINILNLNPLHTTRLDEATPSPAHYFHYLILTPGQFGNWRKFSIVMRSHLFNIWSLGQIF